MIEECCRIYYNIARKLRCGLRPHNCLCPDKNTYEYFCYLCYDYNRKHGKVTDEEYKFKIHKDTGEITIEHEFEHEFICNAPAWKSYGLINIVIQDIQGEIRKIGTAFIIPDKPVIRLTALALTQSLSFRDADISFIHMIDAFRTGHFMKHFLSLSMAVMRRFQQEKDCGELLEQLSQCIRNVHGIYAERGKISRQFQNYYKLIRKGLERENIDVLMHEASYEQLDDVIEKKINANSVEKFLFQDIKDVGGSSEYDSESSDAFIDICYVLREYIINYQKNMHGLESSVYDNVLSSLNLLLIRETDVNSIRGLEKINFQSVKAWPANAGLIWRYFQRIEREMCL